MSSTQMNRCEIHDPWKQHQLRQGITEAEERLDTLYGEGIHLDGDKINIQNVLEHLHPCDGERARLYDRLDEIEARQRVLQMEQLLVELESVRLAITLNHALRDEARERGTAEADRLFGQWMRLEGREDELDAAIQEATGGQLCTAKIAWPDARM